MSDLTFTRIHNMDIKSIEYLGVMENKKTRYCIVENLVLGAIRIHYVDIEKYKFAKRVKKKKKTALRRFINSFL